MADRTSQTIEKPRRCLRCFRRSTVPAPLPSWPFVDRHDACIANLPGVMFACCGHLAGMPYLVERGGASLYGRAAVRRMRELGGHPPTYGPIHAALVRRHGVATWAANLIGRIYRG